MLHRKEVVAVAKDLMLQKTQCGVHQRLMVKRQQIEEVVHRQGEAVKQIEEVHQQAEVAKQIEEEVVAKGLMQQKRQWLQV